MNWAACFIGALTAFSAGKIVVALRTGEIGMSFKGSGHNYRRSEERFGFYRAVVIQGLATVLLAAMTVVAIRYPS